MQTCEMVDKDESHATATSVPKPQKPRALKQPKYILRSETGANMYENRGASTEHYSASKACNLLGTIEQTLQMAKPKLA